MKGKKIVSTALAAALTLSMQTSVFAAEVSDSDTSPQSVVSDVQESESAVEQSDEVIAQAGTIEKIQDEFDYSANVAAVSNEDDDENTTSGQCGDNLTWTFDESTGILTISGNGDMWDYGYDAPWYDYLVSIKEVKFNGNITSIGADAFYGCSSLTSITIPDSVTSIGGWAFEDCTSLTSITIPNSVTSIDDCAFYGCSSLTSITIPDSVTYIGADAFCGCTSLTNISVDNKNKKYASKDGVLFNNDFSTLICCPNSKSGNYVIPNSVTSIGEGAFEGCSSLTSITIPDSVTAIGDYAFEGCSSLTSITIPNSVTAIGDWAFAGCSSLTSITIPNSVTAIGDGAFAVCSSLTSVTIPDSVTAIGDWAFAGCSSLTSITIPNSVTAIGDGAFEDCTSLTSITIPDSVTAIGESAFTSCFSFSDVYYAGTESDWKNIEIGQFNDELLNAHIHFNSVLESTKPSTSDEPTNLGTSNEQIRPTVSDNSTTITNTAPSTTIENVQTGENSTALPWLAFIASTLSIGLVLAFGKFREIKDSRI